MTEFETVLRGFINKHNKENGSDTPDFILSRYLVACLDAFDIATRTRDGWYGRTGLSGEGDHCTEPDAGPDEEPTR